MVAEGAPDLGDEIGEVRLGDERSRPQPLQEVRLGQGLGALCDEHRQQLESLGSEVNFHPAAPELARVEIEDKWPEPNAGHRFENPVEFLARS